VSCVSISSTPVSEIHHSGSDVHSIGSHLLSEEVMRPSDWHQERHSVTQRLCTIHQERATRYPRSTWKMAVKACMWVHVWI